MPQGTVLRGQRIESPPEIAARQHTLVTIGQLRAAGLTDSAVGKRVKRGVLHREYRGIPVTSVARLLVDMTDVSDVGEIANLIHEAAFLGRFSELATRDAMERANGRHNLRVLEQALTAHIEGSAGTKSRKERAFKRLIEAAGLPTPQSNVHVEGIEVDLFWPNRKLCAEVDGSGHGRRPTRREDDLKDRLLTAYGYTVLRFTDEEIERSPQTAIARLAACL